MNLSKRNIPRLFVVRVDPNLLWFFTTCELFVITSKSDWGSLSFLNRISFANFDVSLTKRCSINSKHFIHNHSLVLQLFKSIKPLRYLIFLFVENTVEPQTEYSISFRVIVRSCFMNPIKVKAWPACVYIIEARHFSVMPAIQFSLVEVHLEKILNDGRADDVRLMLGRPFIVACWAERAVLCGNYNIVHSSIWDQFDFVHLTSNHHSYVLIKVFKHVKRSVFLKSVLQRHRFLNDFFLFKFLDFGNNVW